MRQLNGRPAGPGHNGRVKIDPPPTTTGRPAPDAPGLVRPYVADLEVSQPEAAPPGVSETADTEVLAPVAAPPVPAAAPAGPPPASTGVGRCHRRARRHCAVCAHHRRRRRARAVTTALVGLAVVAVAVLAVASLRGRHPQPGSEAAPGGVPTGSPRASAPAAPTGAPTPTAVADSTAAAVPLPSRPVDSTSAASTGSTGNTASTGSPRATGEAADADGTLRAGDRGPAVAQLQRLLFAQGFTYVTVDGDYDAATVRGVAQLQQDRDLTGDPSGVYGPATRAALTSDG